MASNEIGIVLTVDSRAVSAELGRAGQALDNFGSQAQKSAAQTESGMRRVNVSISEVAKSQIAATEAILADQRAKAQAAAQNGFLTSLREQIALYGKTTDEVTRYRAAQLGVAGAAEPLLQQLASQRAAQEHAAKAAREEAAAQREAASAKKQAETAQLSFLDSLRDQVALQGKSQTEILRYRAAQLGVGKDAETYIAALEKAANATGQVGVSARQTAAALRGIPAQFTDIVVSLSSGQAPLTVLLQQGGQLKDMFGGIGPAAKAVGEYVAGLVNPFTLAAAAAAVLYIAHEQGRKESILLNEALLKTGSITGMTTGQLNEMAKALGAGEFTRGAAAAALAEMAGTGAIASKNLQGFTQTALDMQRYVGTSVEETAKVFKSLGDEPTQASLKLNDSLHYLTRTQYEQIKALEEHGRKTEAARIAQQTYSDALGPMLESAKQNLGLLEGAWRSVSGVAKEAWDSMLNVGRQVSLEDRLAGAKKLLADFEKTSAGKRTTEQVALVAKVGGVEGLKGQIAGLEELIDTQRKAAQADAERQKVQEAGIKWAQEGEKYLTREARLRKEIASIEALGQAAGQSAGEIAARVALARQEYDKAVASANAEALITAAKGNAKRYGDYYKQELDAFRLSTADYLETIKALDTQALQVERRAVAGEKPVTAEDRIRQKSRLSELDIQIREVGARYQRALEDEDLKNQKVLENLGMAAGKALDPMTQAGQAFASQYGGIMRRAAADGNEAILEGGRAVWEAMANKTQFDGAKKLYEDLFAKLTTQLDAVRQAADLDGGLFAHIDAAGKAEEIKNRLLPSINDALDKMRQFKGTDLVSDKAVVEAEANVKKLTNQADPYFKKMADSLENSMTDALLRGFESGKGFARNFRDTLANMFKTLVLRPVIQAVVSPVSVALTGALGGSSAAMAGQSGGSMLGAAGNAASLYNASTALGSAWAVGSQWYAGSMSGANAAGTLAANATGTGIDGLLATNGAYGTAGQTAAAESGLAAAYGPYASALGGALVGYMVGKMISGGYSVVGQSGNVAVAAGTAIGLAVGGPIGAAIGGAIGGAVNRAFGMKAKEVTSGGISGTFSASGADVRQYSDWHQSGGWFRSSRDGTEYSAASSALNQYLDQAVQGVTAANRAYAASLGLSADAVAGFSQSVKINLQGLDEAGQQKAIEAALGKFGAAMVDSAWGSALEAYHRTSETSVQTLTRLSTSLTSVNQVFDTLSQKAYTASLAGADMAQQLADAFGGLDKLQAATSSYYQSYYSEAERTATTTRQVTASLGALGYALPATRAGFRALLEAQDLTTASGRTTWSALMGLQGAFASITKSSDELATTLKSALDAAAQALASLVNPLLSAISQAQSGVTSARGSITGATTMTARQIQDAIASASISLPNASGVMAAQGAVDRAYRRLGQFDRLDQMETAYAPMYQKAAQAFVSSMQNPFILSLPEQYQLTGGWTYSVPLQDQLSYLNGLNRNGLNFNLATPDSVAASNYKGGFSMPSAQPYAQQVWDAYNYVNQTLRPLRDSLGSRSSAEADLASAQAGLVSAKSAYAQAMRDYVADAGKAVEKLNGLRDATVAYYQQQKALADTLLGSATKLRSAIDSVRLGQLDAVASLAQKRQDFDRLYSLALATSGTTQAGYADQMTAALPELAAALKETAASRSDWALAVARLTAQSSAIASSLQAAAPVDYQAQSLGLLDTIDGTLSAISSATSSAEKVISDAIYATSADNLAGLRAIVTQLGGTPAFASGGYTGPGGKHEAAGIVHRGEVVWSQADVARVGGVQVAEALRQGRLRGYAEGGAVAVPAVPVWRFPAVPAAAPSSGREEALLAEIKEILQQEFDGLRAETRSTVVNTSKTARILQHVTPEGDSIQMKAAT